MQEEMTLSPTKGWALRTLLGVAIMLDYFLFTTGNPSLTYSLLGGWFEIPLVILIVLCVTYAITVLKKKQQNSLLGLYFGVLVIVSVALVAMSGLARRHAEARMDEIAAHALKDPGGTEVSSASSKQIATEITAHNFSLEREAFIPTFRRADYSVHVEGVGQYQLVLTLDWRGVPEVFLSRRNP